MSGKSRAEINIDEIMIESGKFALVTAPHGASLHGLVMESVNGLDEVITWYTGATNKVGGQGDVLIPFPGRIANGVYHIGAETFQLGINDKEGPNAIHGFVRGMDWSVGEQSSENVTYSITTGSSEVAGYPFALEVEVKYAVVSDGMTCSFNAKNVSTTAAPIAAGFHPYFTVGSSLIDSCVLELPMQRYLEVENLIPTGKIIEVAGTEFDFTKPRKIGQTQFNTCFASPISTEDSTTRIVLSNPESRRTVEVWMDKSFPYVVLYSGDPLPQSHRRKSLAIEPMTCAADGFNHPEWGNVMIEPGQSLSGSWGVRVRSTN